MKAVLFDLDGTIVDLRGVHFEALNTALERCDCKPITLDEHEAEFDGLPTSKKLDMLIKRKRVPSTLIARDIALVKQTVTNELIRDLDLFNPSMYCLFAGLHGMGIKVGVVSNAMEVTVRTVLQRMDLPVRVVVGGPHENPKPAPDPYCQAIRQLNLKPSECLAIEDNRYGIESAEAAGCRILRVEGPHQVTPANVWSRLRTVKYISSGR